ncbi:MAG: hypothetical protein KBD78_01550 [Oligoflexales bacterium]|nr:hypothetical protein [Oligoflexales bacterium]
MNSFKLSQGAENSTYAENSQNSTYNQFIQSIAKTQQTQLYDLPIYLSPLEQQYWLEQLDSQFHFVRLLKASKEQ